MSTIAEKLLALTNIKAAIKSAIAAKGVSVPLGTPFANYAGLIGNIITGGGGETLTVGDTAPESPAEGDYWLETEVEYTAGMLSPVAWFDALDADTITLVNSKVSRCSDKSGHNFHADQTDPANRPAYDAENNGIIFSENKHLISMVAMPLLTNKRAVYAVISESTASSFNIFGYGNYATNKAFSLGVNDSNYPFAVLHANDTTATTQLTEGISLLCMSYDGTNIKIELDGAIVLTVAKTPETAMTTVLFYIGVYIDAVARGTFELHELCLFRDVLSSADNESLMGHFAWKWGVEDKLPVGHAYKSSPPMVSILKYYNGSAWAVVL